MLKKRVAQEQGSCAVGDFDRSRIYVIPSDLIVAQVRQKKLYEGSGMHTVRAYLRGDGHCNNYAAIIQAIICICNKAERS